MAKYSTLVGERVKGKIEELTEFFATQRSGRADYWKGLLNMVVAGENDPVTKEPFTGKAKNAALAGILLFEAAIADKKAIVAKIMLPNHPNISELVPYEIDEIYSQWRDQNMIKTEEGWFKREP